MSPASYLPCALLLLTAAVHAQVPPSNISAQNPSAPDASGQNSGTQDALAAAASAVQQEVVPLSAEPHHRLVLQNDFARVYSVSVPPLDATLMHRHDLPYLAVNLGPADLENLVVGKPKARMVLPDGQVVYSPGGFVHLVRTDSGIPFRNVTVELAKPQGTARNICNQIVAGPLGECPQRAEARGKKAVLDSADEDIPYFETDEVRVEVIQVAGGKDYVEESPKLDSLLVALTNANLDANLRGEHISFLHDGDILWMPAGAHRKVVDFLGTRSGFLLVSFKDSAGAAKP